MRCFLYYLNSHKGVLCLNIQDAKLQPKSCRVLEKKKKKSHCVSRYSFIFNQSEQPNSKFNCNCDCYSILHIQLVPAACSLIASLSRLKSLSATHPGSLADSVLLNRRGTAGETVRSGRIARCDCDNSREALR